MQTFVALLCLFVGVTITCIAPRFARAEVALDRIGAAIIVTGLVLIGFWLAARFGHSF